MSSPDPNILKKIRQLAAMADLERNPNPNEVAVAAVKMQQLMDQYNVSLLEVMEDEKSDPLTFTEQSTEGILGVIKPWHWGLARTIGRIMSTKHFATGAYGNTLRQKVRVMKNQKQQRGHRMTFFGAKNSIQASCELFDMWVLTIEKMAVEATSKYCQEMQDEEQWIELMEYQGVNQFRHLRGLGEDHPTVWRASWLTGVIQGINTALDEQEETTRPRWHHPRSEAGKLQAGQPTAPGSAIVLFHEKLDLAYKERSSSFQHVGSSHSRANWDAMGKGHAVGKKLNLTSKQLNGGK